MRHLEHLECGRQPLSPGHPPEMLLPLSIYHGIPCAVNGPERTGGGASALPTSVEGAGDCVDDDNDFDDMDTAADAAFAGEGWA